MSTPTAAIRKPPVKWPRMRPRFVLEVGCEADYVMEALDDEKALRERGIEGRFSSRHGVLTPVEEARHFWSTQLGITVEDPYTGIDGTQHSTRVLGVFSPHPEIWTAYVFAIGTLTTLGVLGMMYGIVQLTMGHAPWALLAPLITALAGGLVYTSTLVGQGLAADEMYTLRAYLDDCLQTAQTRALREPGTARESAQL